MSKATKITLWTVVLAVAFSLAIVANLLAAGGA